MTYDALILGAGAAGCMAAIQAGKRGRKVLLLDQGKRIGGKLPVSGGGRCNFTNRNASSDHYLSNNPRFSRSALSRFSAADVEAWVAAAGIPFHEKTEGQLFCDRSALDIVGLLERELAAAGVEVRLNARLETLEASPSGFKALGLDWQEEASQVVLALGGLSYPDLGANDLGLRLAAQFGLKIIDTAPALDGFVFSAQDRERYEGLPGIAVKATLKAGSRRFEGDLLFTHQGLSGPVALQASLFWRAGGELKVDLCPLEDLEASMLLFKKTEPRSGLVAFLSRRWPRRLAERWVALHAPEATIFERISDKDLRALASACKAWAFTPAGTVGWSKAEVTRGGVDTDGLNQKTMGAKNVKGLYVVGELVDVTGELGGYNYQWAWSSGWCAGNAL